MASTRSNGCPFLRSYRKARRKQIPWKWRSRQTGSVHRRVRIYSRCKFWSKWEAPGRMKWQLFFRSASSRCGSTSLSASGRGRSHSTGSSRCAQAHGGAFCTTHLSRHRYMSSDSLSGTHSPVKSTAYTRLCRMEFQHHRRCPKCFESTLLIGASVSQNLTLSSISRWSRLKCKE